MEHADHHQQAEPFEPSIEDAAHMNPTDMDEISEIDGIHRGIIHEIASIVNSAKQEWIRIFEETVADKFMPILTASEARREQMVQDIHFDHESLEKLQSQLENEKRELENVINTVRSAKAIGSRVEQRAGANTTSDRENWQFVENCQQQCASPTK